MIDVRKATRKELIQRMEEILDGDVPANGPEEHEFLLYSEELTRRLLTKEKL